MSSLLPLGGSGSTEPRAEWATPDFPVEGDGKRGVSLSLNLILQSPILVLSLSSLFLQNSVVNLKNKAATHFTSEMGLFWNSKELQTQTSKLG